MRRSRACCRGILGALVLCAFAIPALAGPVSIVAEGPETPAGAHRYVVHSPSLRRDFVIVVSAPSGPFVQPGRKLPAIYALDAGYGVTGPLVQLMSWSGTMTPAYVVSIGYPDGAGAARDADLLFEPVTMNGVTSGGGGAAFEAFLLDELRPFLAARYPTEPAHDVLFGHSFGGLFAANVLANRPDAFGGYIVASPSVWAGPAVLQRLRAAAARGGGRKVLVTVGDGEEQRMTDGAAAVAAALSGPESTWKIERRTFAGSHIGYYPALVPAAAAAVLPPPVATRRHTAIELPAAALDRLVGVYAIGDGRTVTVRNRDGKLYALLTGSPEGGFLPESASRFFTNDAPGIDITLTFEGRIEAAPDALVLSVNGAQTRAVRTAMPR